MSRKSLRAIIVIVFIELLTVVGGILANLLAPLLPPVLTFYLQFQLIGPLLGIVTVALIFLAVLQYHWQSLTELPILRSNSQSRQRMLVRVRGLIAQELEQSLRYKVHITLGLHEQPN